MGGEGERIQRFLTEFRMMVAAVGVLVGFLLHTTFTEPFLRMDAALRAAHVAALLCATISFVALLFPPSLHRLISEKAHPEEFLRAARASVRLAFVALALALTLSFGVQTTRAFAPSWGLAAAAVVGATVLLGWFVIPRRVARRLERQGRPAGDSR